jgi:hypothetical protein
LQSKYRNDGFVGAWRLLVRDMQGPTRHSEPIHLKLLGLSPVPLVLLGVFLYPPLRADDSWTMAEPLPAPMGEIMGTVVAGKWYIMAGLDTKIHKPLGAYMFSIRRTMHGRPGKRCLSPPTIL